MKNYNEIVMRLASDPELLKTFLDMKEALDKAEAASTGTPAQTDTVSLYAVVRHTEDGTAYYHPMVIPTAGMSEDPASYKMISNADLIELQEEGERYVSMYRSMYHDEPIILNVTKEVYGMLEEKLYSLINAVFTEVDQFSDRMTSIMGRAFDKANVLSAVMQKMTVAGTSLKRDGSIAEEHEMAYVEDRPVEYDDDYDDDYDDEDYDEEDYDEEDEDCCDCDESYDPDESY